MTYLNVEIKTDSGEAIGMGSFSLKEKNEFISFINSKLPSTKNTNVAREYWEGFTAGTKESPYIVPHDGVVIEHRLIEQNG